MSTRARLYTTLAAVKMALRGELPPMAQIPERLRDVLDPAFCLGMGGIKEVKGKGLQCPYRECGVWRDRLDLHLKAHGDEGGYELKRMLSIPRLAPLVSRELSEKMGRAARRRMATGVNPLFYANGKMRPVAVAGRRKAHAPEVRSRRVRNYRATTRTTGHKNMLNNCEAQLAGRMLDVQNRLGRSPTSTEANELDPGLVEAVSRLYGSWDGGKTSIGLKLANHSGGGKKLYTRQAIVDLFANHYEANGTLPTCNRVVDRLCLPPVPTYGCVQKYFPEHIGWPKLMDHMAWKIGITDGRYGKPEYAKKDMEAA